MQLGTFSFQIKSTATESKLIVLLPGSFPVIGLSGADWASRVLHYHDATAIKNAGYNVDAVIDDGVGNDAGDIVFTPADSEFGIQHFLHHIKNNPYKVGQIMIQADNPDVFNEKLVIQRDNPTMGQAKRFIRFTEYFKPTQYQDNKIVIEEPNLFLSDETFMMMTMPGSRTVTFHYNRLQKL